MDHLDLGRLLKQIPPSVLVPVVHATTYQLEGAQDGIFSAARVLAVRRHRPPGINWDREK